MFKPLQPVELWRLFVAGTIITVTAFGAAIGFGVLYGQWRNSSLNTGREIGVCSCAEQLRKRRENIARLAEEIESSAARQATLHACTSDRANPHFRLARGIILEEKSHETALKNELEKIQGGEVLNERFVAVNYLILAAVIVLSFIAARLMMQHAFGAVMPGIELRQWGRPYCALVSVIFLTHLGRELATSVVAIDKPMFGWNSFCITPEAWVFTQVTMMGLAMALACPATTIWVLGRARYRPVELDPVHPDRAWGVADYVLFLQTWAISSVVFFLAPTLAILLIWFRKGGLPVAYAVPSRLYSVIVGRLIWGGIKIRCAYQEKLRSLGWSWDSDQRRKPPPDPASLFLGEHWWQLPATIIGALAMFSLLIEWSGILDILL